MSHLVNPIKGKHQNDKKSSDEELHPEKTTPADYEGRRINYKTSSLSASR